MPFDVLVRASGTIEHTAVEKATSYPGRYGIYIGIYKLRYA